MKKVFLLLAAAVGLTVLVVSQSWAVSAYAIAYGTTYDSQNVPLANTFVCACGEMGLSTYSNSSAYYELALSGPYKPPLGQYNLCASKTNKGRANTQIDYEGQAVNWDAHLDGTSSPCTWPCNQGRPGGP